MLASHYLHSWSASFAPLSDDEQKATHAAVLNVQDVPSLGIVLKLEQDGFPIPEMKALLMVETTASVPWNAPESAEMVVLQSWSCCVYKLVCTLRVLPRLFNKRRISLFPCTKHQIFHLLYRERDRTSFIEHQKRDTENTTTMQIFRFSIILSMSSIAFGYYVRL